MNGPASTKRPSRITWKKEAAALACGLLLGSAWEAAHAGVVASAMNAIARQAHDRPPHRP